MVVSVVVIIMLYRGSFKYLPRPLMLTILCFFIMYLTFDTSDIHHMILDTHMTNVTSHEQPWYSFDCAGEVLFLAAHWIITSHYLSMAMLFKL